MQILCLFGLKMIILLLLLSFGLAMYGETNNDHGYPQIGNHPQGWDSREQTKEYWTKVGNAELKKGMKYHKNGFKSFNN